MSICCDMFGRPISTLDTQVLEFIKVHPHCYTCDIRQGLIGPRAPERADRYIESSLLNLSLHDLIITEYWGAGNCYSAVREVVGEGISGK